MHAFCILEVMKWLSYLPILVFVLITGCGKVEEPKFRRLDSFGIKKLGLQESTVGFNAVYFNPNSFGVTVKEAALDVFIDSSYLGKFVQPAAVSVTDNAEFSIPLEGKISLQNALALNIQNLVGKEVLIRADGAVKVGKAGVFVTKDINYKGRHVLDMDLIKNPAGAGFSR